MTRKISFRDGDAEVVMDDTIAEMVEAVLEDRLGFVLRALEWHFEELQANIERNWPVKSGYSKRNFRTGLAVTGRGKVSSFLENDVDYIWFVKGRRQGGRQSWRLVVLGPAEKLEATLIKVAGDEILKLQKVG